MLNSSEHGIYPTEKQKYDHLTDKKIMLMLIYASRPTTDDVLTFIIKKWYDE